MMFTHVLSTHIKYIYQESDPLLQRRGERRATINEVLCGLRRLRIFIGMAQTVYMENDLRYIHVYTCI